MMEIHSEHTALLDEIPKKELPHVFLVSGGFSEEVARTLKLPMALTDKVEIKESATETVQDFLLAQFCDQKDFTAFVCSAWHDAAFLGSEQDQSEPSERQVGWLVIGSVTNTELSDDEVWHWLVLFARITAMFFSLPVYVRYKNGGRIIPPPPDDSTE